MTLKYQTLRQNTLLNLIIVKFTKTKELDAKIKKGLLNKSNISNLVKILI